MNVARLIRMATVVMLAGATAVSGGSQAPASAPLTVFAASDLGPAFRQIVPEFERKTRTGVTLVLGSTGMLAQQIRNGAPADLFFAANENFITELAAENLTLRDTHALYARGRIAAVTLKSGGLRIDNVTDLDDARIRRIAIANPQHAPYGLAARQALQFVRSGSAQAGLVARSVADTPDLQWTLVDDRLHAPLDQMAVVLARTKHADAAKSFLDFVNGLEGRGVMRQFGFLLPGETF
jgi:molybdate transport system substrate-binding protein